MTGPSLADVWGRRSGTAEDFARYSEVLTSADLEWNDEALDEWLTSPQGFLPGNYMTFKGIADRDARDNLIALLRSVASGSANQTVRTLLERPGEMEPEILDLRTLGARNQVAAIQLCGDTYRVTTVDGELQQFREINLRFSVNSSGKGPVAGQPAIIASGMRGDRAMVIFAAPTEISAFIQKEC